MAARTRGSVRFDPYYKTQWWDDRTLAWRDVQRSYPTPDDARASIAGRPGRWRLVRVSEAGRDFFPEQEAIR